jgi:hypothetical protein
MSKSEIDRRMKFVVELLNGGIDNAIKQGNTPIIEVYTEIRNLIHDMYCINISLFAKVPVETYRLH